MKYLWIFTSVFYRKLPVIFQNIPAASLQYFSTNITGTLYIYFKPLLRTQFSHHILCSVFGLFFDIAVVFQNQPVDLFGLPCHVLTIFTCTELQPITHHIYGAILNSRNIPLKVKFDYLCTNGCCRLRNTLLVKVCAS